MPESTNELLHQLHDRLISMDDKNDRAHNKLGEKLDEAIEDVSAVKVRVTKVEGDVSDLKVRSTEAASSVKELQTSCADVKQKIAVTNALTRKQKINVASIGAGSGAIIMALIEIIKHLLGSGGTPAG